VVVVGDGAPWIWNLAAEHFPRRVEIRQGSETESARTVIVR